MNMRAVDQVCKYIQLHTDIYIYQLSPMERFLRLNYLE